MLWVADHHQKTILVIIFSPLVYISHQPKFQIHTVSCSVALFNWKRTPSGKSFLYLKNWFIQSVEYYIISRTHITKMRYWIISYLCCSRFRFPSKSLLLRQIQVIAHQIPLVHLQLAWSLIWSPSWGTYTLVPFHLSMLGVVFCAWSILQNNYGRYEFKWVSLCRCAQNYYGERRLLRQSQSQTRFPVWIPGPHETWDLISMDFPGVWPRNRDLNLAVNQTCNVEMVSSIFAAMRKLKVMSTNCASLPITPSTERTHGEKCFLWGCQCFWCLSFFIFYHLGKCLYISFIF